MNFIWKNDVYCYKSIKLNWFSKTYTLTFNKSWRNLGITLNWATRVYSYTDKILTKTIQKCVRDMKVRYWFVKYLPTKFAQKVCPYHMLPPEAGYKSWQDSEGKWHQSYSKGKCLFCGKLINDSEKLPEKLDMRGLWRVGKEYIDGTRNS